MQDRKNELFTYFTNNINIQENLIETMKRLNVFHLLYDKLENIDKKETIYQKIRQIRQKKFNSIAQHEMINLHKMALEYNIQVVFLKGLTFAEELYEPRELRKFGDIDVLVDNKDIDKFLDILGREGYIDTRDYISVSSERKSYYTYAHHLCPFIIKRELDDFETTICLEAHLCPFYFGIMADYKNIDISQMINRSRKLFISEDYVYALEIHDALVHRLWDFTRNYIYDIQDMFKWGSCVNPNLSMLHDAVLFIDRHNQDIDWDVVIRRCKEWHICGNVLFASLILNTIYGSVIPTNVISDLEDNMIVHDASLERRLVPQLIDLDFDTMILGNSLEYMQDIYGKIKFPGVKLQCPKAVSQQQDIDIGAFIIDETKSKKFNKFGTHLRWGESPRTSLDGSVKGSLSWNDRYIYVEARIYGKDLKSPKDLSYLYTEKDVIFLWFDVGRYSKEQYFPRGIGIRVDKKEVDGNYQLVIESIYDTKDIKGFDVKKIRIHEDGYEFMLGIPWSFFGIIPYEGMKLGFDLVFIKYLDEEQDIKTELALSSINKQEDPTLFALVELV